METTALFAQHAETAGQGSGMTSIVIRKLNPSIVQ